jgi:hypothetical protein
LSGISPSKISSTIITIWTISRLSIDLGIIPFHLQNPSSSVANVSLAHG